MAKKNIAQRTVHENAMNMIRRGLALIAIDPRTEALPDKVVSEGDKYEDFWMTAEEVHEILETLAEYVGEAPESLFEGGRNCTDDAVAYDALLLASACTDGPSYATVGDMQGLSYDLFCNIHFIESPDEYAA